MTNEVWFITGASTGLGRAVAEAVLDCGYAVVATARKLESISDLGERHPEAARTMTLDVDDLTAIPAVVDAASATFGGIDFAVNNAGYALIGAFEELHVHQVRAQLETNFYGAWAVTQAVLPIMRARRRGTIINVSSQGGIVGMPGTAAYSASKFALEGMSEAVAAEVAEFGIRVMIVEPGPFRTDMRRRSLEIPEQRIADYPDYGNNLRRQDGTQVGDPRLAARAIIAAATAPDPPLRLVLGASAVDAVRAKLERASADVSAWEATSVATAFTDDGAAEVDS